MGTLGLGRIVPLAVLFSVFSVVSAADAVIFYSTADPSFNTTAPTGDLAGSGWQWVGDFDGYAGTPISAHYFLAAAHVGGAVGDAFIFSGSSYKTTAYFDDAVSDLRIWEVDGTFPTWAPLYRNSTEVGRQLLVCGMGWGRGSAVMVGSMLNGWMWNSGSSALRWGTNYVFSAGDYGAPWGNLLYALFQASSDPNEADLALGDSSGPVFINDGEGWKLAGIAAAVDGPFNTTNVGNGFNAAIFDARGLYVGGSGNWTLVTGSAPAPSGFYATQVSVRASWIDSIVSPGVDSPIFAGPQGAILVALILLTGLIFLRRAELRAQPE
jgi:hypothetical protein